MPFESGARESDASFQASVAAGNNACVGDDRLILATSLNYWRYATIGPPGSKVRRLPLIWTWRRRRSGEEFKVAGWWGLLGRARAAVFVREGELRIAVERQEWALDDRLQVDLRREGRHTRLRVVRDGATVAERVYRTPRRPREHWLDWPLAEDDYDFGAFIMQMTARRMQDPQIQTVWPFTRTLRRATETAR